MLERGDLTRSYYVELSFLVRDDGNPADLATHIDPLLEAFEQVDGLSDVDLGADLERSAMQICMHLPASTGEEALAVALVAARTAIHAAGHGTPGWEGSFGRVLETGQYASMVRPADLITA